MNTTQFPRLPAFALAAATAAVLGVAALPVAAQTRGNNQVVLNAGTVIPVTLNTELSSNNSHNGEQFTASVDNSRQAYNNILSGASVDGVVRQVTPQQGKDPGSLTLAFTRIRLSDGRTVAISGSPTSLDTKDLTESSDGMLVAKNTKKNNTLTYAGIGAGAGLLVGVLTGQKVKLENILIGGGLGAAAAQILKGQAQVHDVDLKPGTPLGVRLDQGTRYYHRNRRNMGNGNANRPGNASGNGADVAVRVNGSPVNFPGQGPIQNNGHVLVPLRGVLEKLGAYVTYNSARRQVRAVRDQKQIVLPIGSRTARVDGNPVSLDTPARIVNGSTMVPLRFVAEALGAKVNYEAARRTVVIRTDNGQ